MAEREQDPNNNQTHEPDWLKYLNHQGDWLEKTRGNLMVAATVIASMSFQVVANPPGGVFQEDQCPDHTHNQTNHCKKMAGTSVLAYSPKRAAYVGLMISSTVSFSASLSIILLVISGLRLRNRMVMGILILFMVLAVFCMVSTYAFSVMLVQSEDVIVGWILLVYVAFWLVFPAIVVVIQICRFVIWVLCLFCCCQRQPSNSPVAAHA